MVSVIDLLSVCAAVMRGASRRTQSALEEGEEAGGPFVLAAEGGLSAWASVPVEAMVLEEGAPPVVVFEHLWAYFWMSRGQKRTRSHRMMVVVWEVGCDRQPGGITVAQGPMGERLGIASKQRSALESSQVVVLQS